MSRQSPNAGIGGRTQQAGTLVAATLLPITFQPTLMPRSPLDQALVTGISTSLNYSFAALIQDSIEALALGGAGRTDPSTVDRQAWRRVSAGLDLAAIAAGLAAQRALAPRPGERLPRGGARTAAWWLSSTGLSGAVMGLLQELTGRRGDTQDRSVPVAPFAGAALAAVNDFRRRRWEARFPGLGGDEGAPASAAKSFAMSLGVTARLTGLAAGERLFATGVGRVAERALPGHERLYRPLGHLAACRSWAAPCTGWSPGRPQDRAGAEQVEAAFDDPPTSRLVSSGPGERGGLGDAQSPGPAQRGHRGAPRADREGHGRTGGRRAHPGVRGPGERPHRGRAGRSRHGRAGAHRGLRPGAADGDLPHRHRVRQLRGRGDGPPT
jgi:hypothetical protein